MPTAATMGGGNATKRGDQNRQVLPSVPFIRASAEHREPTGIDVSRQITTADQQLGVFDVPAYGYVRSLFVVVTTSGGSGGSAAAAEDAPWNALKDIAVTEPNGATIYQAANGHSTFLHDKWGGYRAAYGSDFRASPTYSAVNATTGQFAYCLRIPIEINLRDGLGSLPNQNAAATFKLRLNLAASTQIYSTPPATTLPTIRVRVYLEAWDQPESQSGGAVNQLTPPAMNTTQFWSEQVYNVNAGNQTIRLTRVGNYLRSVICVYRRAGTSRANGHTDWPDPLSLVLDTRPLDIVERNNWLHQMFERSGNGGAVGATVPANETPRGLDNGVFVYDFAHEFDGSLGQENRDLWLPTLSSTRLELQGTFANAGTLTVLTNDIAIAGNVFM